MNYLEKYADSKFAHAVVYAYGFTELVLDQELLKLGKVGLARAQGLMQDGTPFNVPENAPIKTVRAAWKQAVRDTHPDVMIARGVPAEAVKLAERRLIAINASWAEIATKQAA